MVIHALARALRGRPREIGSLDYYADEDRAYYDDDDPVAVDDDLDDLDDALSPARHRLARVSPVQCCEADSDDPSGAVYRRWRGPNPVTWDEAYAEVFAESQACAAAGNYSRPADRRAVLGRMRSYKIRDWLACRAGCAAEQDPEHASEILAWYEDRARRLTQDDTGCDPF